jgi:hypothetical protein
MNAADVLTYGHHTVLQTLEGFPESEWESAGVCGYWSARDVIAHLACYEHLLVEMVAVMEGADPGHLLGLRMEQGDQFNDRQVAMYQDKSGAEVVTAYEQAFNQSHSLVAAISQEQLRQVGTLPLYGPEYAFDDMLVYQYYGHKREHSAQIAAFRDRLKE